MKTIKWHKLTCNKQPVGVRADKKNAWKAITNFIEHNIGFDYTIEAHYDEFPDDIIELEWSATTTQGWDIVEK